MIFIETPGELLSLRSWGREFHKAAPL